MPSSAATPPGHGRSRGRRQILLRLSHEPLHRRAALVRRERPQGRHHGPPGRRRNRRRQHDHRRSASGCPRHVRHLRRRIRPHVRSPRPFRHGRNSHRRHRLPARGPVHRRSHQNRTGRPLADARRGLRRLSPRHRGPARHRRLFHADPGNLQHHRQIPGSRPRPLRSAALRRPPQRRSQKSSTSPRPSIAAR